MKIITTIAALMLATSATAQANSNAETNSAAQSTLSQTFEGNGGAASVSAIAPNNTAPCMRTDAIGVAVFGFGVSGGGSFPEISCMGRAEAEWIVKLMAMPNGQQKNMAIYHACMNIPDIRATLINFGVCVVRGSE